MPNLGGILSPNLTEAQAAAENDLQIARLTIPSLECDVFRLRQPGCAIALLDHGILENGAQPITSSDGRTSLFLDGEIYNGPDIAKQFGLKAAMEELTDPMLCLQLYKVLGNRAFVELNGLFSIVIYDHVAKRLSLISDRYAFRPMYFRIRGDTFVFGSELKAITVLDQEKSVDELGLLELFCFGQQVADRTWLHGYRKTMPGTAIHIQNGKIESEQYWTYEYSESAQKLDDQTYFTRYRYLMDRATERCMKGNKRIGIFLSGGYDSRVVAGSVRNSHLPIPSLTFGDPKSRDVRFAQQLASKLNLQHLAIQDDRPYLAKNCRAIIWRTEGMLPFVNNTSIRFHETMGGIMDIILVGLLGEFGGSHTWPNLLFAHTRNKTMSAIFNKFISRKLPVAKRIFADTFFERTFESLHEEFKKSFETVQNEHPHNIADSWNFQYFQPRGSFQAPTTDRHRFEIRAPHMDSELVDFLLQIPPGVRIEQRIYKKMIAYGYPEIRSVPCTNSAKPVNPNFFHEYAMMTLRYAGGKLIKPFSPILPKRRRLGREMVNLTQQVRSEPDLADKMLIPLLSRGIYPPNIFNSDGIREIVKEQFTGTHDHALFVSLILSWGLAAEYFLYDQIDDVPQELVPAQWR